jgi:glycosyltransferase involved in cell wall biosynthesis
MNKSARISIITPSFNQSEFIEKTILSVLSQETGYENEYIILDGASTDGTLDILKKYSDKIKWVSNPDNGQADAVNKGIAMATGEIIGWLNSDDVYMPGALKKVIGYFDSNPECQWVYGQCNIIDHDDMEIRKWVTKYKKYRTRKFHEKSLLFENCISQPAVFFKKSAFSAVGQLSLDLPYAMDYDLWLRLAKLYQPGIIHDYLASFRVHGHSKSNRNSRKQFVEQYNIHKKYDQRRYYLFLHRVYLYTTIYGYWLMVKLRNQRG